MLDHQKGQIMLIVVLVMVTALTVGLSVVSRSITDKKTSQESSNSEKAFSAAEAGIERSLTTNTNKTYKNTFTNNTTYNAKVTTITGNEFPLNNDQPVLKDDSTTLWLSTYPGYTPPQYKGQITFYWGQKGDNCANTEAANSMAALELVVVSGSTTNPQMTHYAFDPCGPRQKSNNFARPSGGGGTLLGSVTNYQSSATINVTNGLFVEVVPLYAQAYVGAKGCAGCILPNQGTVIQSTGTADNTVRKLVTYHFYPQMPAEMFQYSLFIP